MVSEIRTAIISKIKETYPSGYTVYKDNVSQKFVKPSFLIDIIDLDYSKRIGNIYKCTVSFDVAYFSDKTTSEIKSNILVTEETLLRAFDYAGTYKIINKKTKTTDNVLHIMFDVNYSEIKVEEATTMQTQTTNTNL